MRRNFLLSQFRRVIAGQSKITIAKAFRDTADAPAPRFWVSEARASAIMGKMLGGEGCLEGMNEEKKEMYRELYRRFSKIRRQSPEMSIAEIVFEVVNESAPKSYLSWHRVRSIINKEKRNRRNEKSQSGQMSI